MIVVTLSMVAAPLLIAGADMLARRLARPQGPPVFDTIEPQEPRVLIAGFGRFGQIVARVLRARRIRFTALEISQAQVDFVRRFGNLLYYGDASRLEMLRAAGAGQASVLVIAIDDVEASVTHGGDRPAATSRTLQRPRPGAQSPARIPADGRSASRDIWRETFASSLELAEATLVALGTPREAAASQVRRFRANDEETLRAQAADRDDETKLIATAVAAARQLESLFEADAE